MTIAYSKEEIEDLVRKFNDRTLSHPEWTHHAHLIVAIWYLQKHSFYDAICRLKSGIILLNDSQETKNTGESGYHETITVFWITVIATYIKINSDFSIEQLVNGFLNSSLENRYLSAEFYGSQNIMAQNFRAIYYEPQGKKIHEMTIKAILDANKN